MDHTKHAYEQQAEYPTGRPIIITSGGVAVVVLAMLCLTIIVLYISSRNADSAPYGIIGSVCFFLFGTPIGVLAVNRGWVDIYRIHAEHRTYRRANDQQLQLQAMHYSQSVEVVQPVQLPEPLPQVNPVRFVPAVPRVSEELKAAAGGWVGQLFDPETGKPSRITPNKGQVQIKSPEPEVVDYLASLDMVRVGDNKQLYWNVALYPTRGRVLRAIGSGVKPSPLEQGIGGGYLIGEGIS